MNLQEKIEALEKQSQELEKQLQELKEEVNKKEEQLPKEGCPYFCITAIGNIHPGVWWNKDINKEHLQIGNVFKTREEAECMVERLKVLAELKKLSRPYIFDDNHDNYTICYNRYMNKITVYTGCENQLNIYCFDTLEEVQAAINKIGEDRLKKYYFMVGDEEK